MEADLASNLPLAAEEKEKEKVVHDPTSERGVSDFRHLERARAHSPSAMIRFPKFTWTAFIGKSCDRQKQCLSYYIVDSPWME